MKRFYLCAMFLLVFILALSGYTQAGPGDKPKNVIGGNVWNDLNGDGIQNETSPVTSGVTIILQRMGRDGNVDVDTTTVDSEGKYVFTFKPSYGTETDIYYVIFIKSDGMFFTKPDVGGDAGNSDKEDSDVDPLMWGTISGYSFTKSNEESVDAGIYYMASLQGRVWKDLNKDKILDSGEPGILGEKIRLVNYIDTTIAVEFTTNTTDGAYSFSNIVPGSYYLQYQVPAGYSVTKLPYTATSRPGKTESFPIKSGDALTLINAGLVGHGSITGTVWEGTSNKVSGVVVTAYVCDGASQGIDTTDSDGKYSINNLTADMSYKVIFGNKTNYELVDQGPASDPAPDTRATACSTLTTSGLVFNAGMRLLPKGSISGTVWKDENGNGAKDPDDIVKLGGVIVTAYLCSGAYAGIDTTNSDGSYSINNLNADLSYKVVFGTKENYHLSPKGTYSDADSSNGATECSTLTTAGLVFDAGMFSTIVPTAGITGTVWEGKDNDGIQGPGENKGLSGIIVKAYVCNGAIAGTDTTDKDGMYSIGSLTANLSYNVVFEPKEGYALVNQGTDSDPNPETKATPCSTLTTAGLVFDAGMYKQNPNGQINGRLFVDTDKNGTQTGLITDPGLGGWKVMLLDSLYNPIDSTFTDHSGIPGQEGTYSFNHLAVGIYYVRFINPGGFTFTLQNSGNNDNDDSDVDATGLSDSVKVSKDARREHVDAGVYGNGSIGDFVWNDVTRNNVQDGNDTPIAGVVVNLHNSGGTIIKTDTTDAQGKYLFTDLLAGRYYLDFVTPAGFSIVTPLAGSDTTKDSNISNNGISTWVYLAAGQNNLTIDAGYYQTPPEPAALGDKVWKDVNGNGVQDSGEPGIAGVTVYLYICSGQIPMDTAVTDVNGLYHFTNLAAGSYKVQFVLTAGYTFTAMDTVIATDATDSDAMKTTGMTGCYTLLAGQNNTTVDAGMVPIPQPLPGSIGDFVWNDTDKDGIQDAGETGISSVIVKLYKCSDNSLVAADTTNSSGFYLFTNLTAGGYYIKVTVPAGYSVSPANQGTDDAKDSDINNAGQSACVILAAGDNNMTVDAGLFRTPPKMACIGDFVWMDCDGDGIQDSGESGIPNVTVKLYEWDSEHAVRTTTTNSSGEYYFENVEPGDYYVIFSLPETLKFTKMDQGSNDALDSDADPHGETGKITLAGVNNFTIDAGMVTDLSKLANLGDLVWNDCNRNGIQDPGETGIECVEVKLHVCTSDHTNPKDPCQCGDVVAATKTDKTGKYMFTNIKPGYYCVEIVVPCRYTITKPDQTDDWKDSDIIPSMRHTACIKLNPGETNLTVDAGLYPTPPATIGDLVWIDANKNGIQDNGEKGLCNVNVELYMCGVNKPVAATKTDADGKYIFKNVASNTSYAVKFYLPKGYTFTALDQGKDDKYDSDVCPKECSGMTKFYDVVPDETNLTIDAGMYLLTTTACNYIWKDNNNNGTKDEGEQGIQGVTVELYLCSGNSLVQSVKTDAAGLFTFKDILLESYYLNIIVPAGLKIGKAALQEGSQEVDTDFGANGQSTCFEVTEGASSIGKPIALVLSTTGIRRGAEIPTEFTLQQNYPNPFNPSTTIEFAVPSAGQYTMKVFNMLGQEVITLMNRELPVGYHMVTFDASGLPSGMYIYRLSGSNVVMTKKMMLSK